MEPVIKIEEDAGILRETRFNEDLMRYPKFAEALATVQRRFDDQVKARRFAICTDDVNNLAALLRAAEVFQEVKTLWPLTKGDGGIRIVPDLRIQAVALCVREVATPLRIALVLKALVELNRQGKLSFSMRAVYEAVRELGTTADRTSLLQQAVSHDDRDASLKQPLDERYLTAIVRNLFDKVERYEQEGPIWIFRVWQPDASCDVRTAALAHFVETHIAKHAWHPHRHLSPREFVALLHAFQGIELEGEQEGGDAAVRKYVPMLRDATKGLGTQRFFETLYLHNTMKAADAAADGELFDIDWVDALRVLYLAVTSSRCRLTHLPIDYDRDEEDTVVSLITETHKSRAAALLRKVEDAKNRFRRKLLVRARQTPKRKLFCDGQEPLPAREQLDLGLYAKHVYELAVAKGERTMEALFVQEDLLNAVVANRFDDYYAFDADRRDIDLVATSPISEKTVTMLGEEWIMFCATERMNRCTRPGMSKAESLKAAKALLSAHIDVMLKRGVFDASEAGIMRQKVSAMTEAPVCWRAA